MPQLSQPDTSNGAAATATLRCRPPYRWESVLEFYGARATPGVESIVDACYRRTLSVGGRHGIVEVRESSRRGDLGLTLHHLGTGSVPGIVATARKVFDVDAPTGRISRDLSRDPLLARLLREQPGIRVPGAWDGFELTVRAILGQQISVKAATTLAGRIAERYGEPLAVPDAGGLRHLFPRPERLRRARFNNIGLVRTRAATLRRIASAVAEGEIDFDSSGDADELRARLTRVRGIGDWTAQYVAMRVLKHPDALPATDLGLLKALDPPRRVKPATLLDRAECWRPWRAYAVMLLWGSLSGSGGG